MPWIELHSQLREHPKTAALVEAAGLVDADHAVGKLARLWLWALEYAPDGNLHKFSESQLARASGVDPSQGTSWVGSLVSARWLDTEPRLRIHDWWDYAGYFLRKKWDKQPERWQAVMEDYRGGGKPPDKPPECGTAAAPPRIRSVDSASPPTLTNQPTEEYTRKRAREGERLHGIPGSVDEVIAFGATLNPKVEEDRCRAFWAHYEGQRRENPDGAIFWVTSGEAVVTHWQSKLPAFAGKDITHGNNRKDSRPGADRAAGTLNAGKASQYRGLGKVGGV